MIAIGDRAVAGARALAALSSAEKDAILEKMAAGIDSQREAIKAANEKDLAAGKEAGLSAALIDRLELTPGRIDAMIAGIRQVIALDDPVGDKLETIDGPDGLVIEKVRVPIGVIGIIYESRPNVTADSAALCLKAGNAVILRGGKEACFSNRAVADALALGAEAGMPEGAIQLISTTDRAAVKELVQLVGRVDLVIPRGGESLIRAVTEQARVPVIKHYKGVCHVYVDSSASLDMALSICENAKCQRPGVCNAMETLLVHQQVAPEFLPRLAKRFSELGVELRGDARAKAIVDAMTAATDEDWDEEYLDLILAVSVVDDLDSAIAHIARHGSSHSDAIVADDKDAARRFVQQVDASAVYVNASTRFTDGGVFGMGAEIGISTDKLHARGPMGIKELTTYKYVVHGDGHIR